MVAKRAHFLPLPWTSKHRLVGAFRAVPLTDAKAVKSVVEKFRDKYGAKDVKKYYSKFDVAVLVELVQ